MLHKGDNIILPETLSLLSRLQKDPMLNQFFLVGGTALAMQIGHRYSVDLDFFTLVPFQNSKDKQVTPPSIFRNSDSSS
ncbi:MAG: nucleotidyl transferase AbiEii/AbiGii toxin family protein [Phaeodactylibacter sp.]|nr:nucleotidyl transferase AbiEii/AbiGii toxin family protein [Phaeodactylibacter sp.]MCB9300522.1 nucleotidyl transferase AbiEii/AbiGii toxin family protein [Lewinellaceae bacterium]